MDSPMIDGNFENECFNVGSVISCRTCHNEKIKGEVLAFDPAAKMIALKSVVSGVKSAVHIVNLKNVCEGSVCVEKEAAVDETSALPQINYEKLTRRFNDEYNKKNRSIAPTTVSAVAERVFRTISKTIDEIRWEQEAIVILKTVIIVPPYDVDSVRLKSDSSTPTQAQQHTLGHVKKLVEKSHKERLQQACSSLKASSSASVEDCPEFSDAVEEQQQHSAAETTTTAATATTMTNNGALQSCSSNDLSSQSSIISSTNSSSGGAINSSSSNRKTVPLCGARKSE